MGLGLSNTLINLFSLPDAVTFHTVGEDAFGIGAGWLLVIIFSFVVMWQTIKLFLAVGERYFLVGFLMLVAPWAFAMGGSKSTADIFKGWVRMFASMCLMMVLNVIILKLMLSALSAYPDNTACIPWTILIVAIARVGRKLDSIVMKIGLNPAQTGDGLGKGLPGMLSYMVMRKAASKVLNTAGGASNSTKNGGSSFSTAARSSATATNTIHSTSNNSTRGNNNSQARNSSNQTQSTNSSNATTVPTSITSRGGETTVPQNGTAGTPQGATISSRNQSTAATINTSDTAGSTAQNCGVRISSRQPVGTSPSVNNSSRQTANTAVNGVAGTPPGVIINSNNAANVAQNSAIINSTPPKDRASAPARFSAVPPSAKSVNRRGSAGKGGAGISSRSTQNSTANAAVTATTSISPVSRVPNRAEAQRSEFGEKRMSHGASEASPTVTPRLSAMREDDGTQPRDTQNVAPTTKPSVTSAPRESAQLESRVSSRPTQQPTLGNAGMPPVPTTSVNGITGTQPVISSRPAPPQSSPQPASARQHGNAPETPTASAPRNTTISASPERSSAHRETSRLAQTPVSGIAGTATPVPRVPNQSEAQRSGFALKEEGQRSAADARPRTDGRSGTQFVPTSKGVSGTKAAANVTNNSQKSKSRRKRGEKNDGQ